MNNRNFPKVIQKEFNSERLNPHSPIPLYHQAYLLIRNMINNGLFKPGDLLPSEIEFARSLHIGRQTLRQAMSKLVEEGLVERFSGRGTFVCDNKVGKDFYLDRSFSQEMTELGKKAHSKVIMISNECY